ncbi:helix-turn-helix domain-containing protein [Salicibibacter cibarius]|uniref:Helix-turn-helix domain-containing protein n=1 Tax=Salicibibacter cibarius TaxID=2743000 RepID=A0A7T6Z3G4_9BACI|nr:helix-turn-helix domain-containing protein [Salicibibacter cibarius]QQK76318.1 helix-turn-helix domain-containing protein [Salicibibacter cibarius]
MAELGQFLKEKREEKGWGLDEVQTRTKIQKRYLLSIEEGRYDDLPGAFYARAFIKSYAEALELEPEEVFAEFEHDLPKPRKESVDLPTRTEHSKTKRSSQEGKKKNTVLPSVLVVFFLVAIVAVIWLSNIDGGGDIASDEEEENGEVDIVDETAEEETNGNEENEDNEENEENGENGNNGESENGQLSFGEVDGFNSIYTIDSDSLEITLEFDEETDSYVDFREDPTDDGSIVETAAAPSEATEQDFDFSEHDAITINAGYTPALTIYVNGEELEYELDPGERDFQRITIEKEN